MSASQQSGFHLTGRFKLFSEHWKNNKTFSLLLLTTSLMTNHHSHTETSEGSSHVLLRWFLFLRFVLLRENVRHLTSDLCSVQRTLTMNPEFLQFHPIWSRRSCFSTCYFYVYVYMYIGVYSILFLTFSLYFLLLLLFFLFCDCCPVCGTIKEFWFWFLLYW